MGTLTSLGIHGAPVAAAFIIGVVAWMFHEHGWVPRATSWMFGIAAALLTIGVTAWLDAIAGLTSTGTGLTILIALAIIGGTLVIKHTSDKKKHHPVRSTAIFIVAGVVIVVVIGSFRAITKNAGKSLTGSGKALGQAITQINSGKAAHAVPAGHRLGILIWGVVIFAILVFVAKARHGKGGKKTASSGGAPAAIPSGRSGARGGAGTAVAKRGR